MNAPLLISLVGLTACILLITVSTLVMVTNERGHR